MTTGETDGDGMVAHFEGTCDVCGAALSFDWDYADGIIDIGYDGERSWTWVRHIEGVNPDCARYSSRVYAVPPPATSET